VPPEYEGDPWLAAVKEPTFEGVYRAKLLLESGFLSARLADPEAAGRLDDTAQALIRALQAKNRKEISKQEKALADLSIRAWRRYRAGGFRSGRKGASPAPNRQRKEDE
jgi:hypothetical protein